MNPDTVRQLDRIEQKLDLLLKGQTLMAATLDQVLQDVTDETTTIAGLSTFIQGLQAQIAGLSLPPKIQAQVDAIFNAAEANKAALAAALAANVPPTP